MMAALMGGGPLPLPSIACALCLAIDHNDTGNGNAGQSSGFVESARTLAAGWLVCAFHAEVLAHQLAETNYGANGGPDPIRHDGTRRDLADSFTLPPAVMP